MTYKKTLEIYYDDDLTDKQTIQLLLKSIPPEDNPAWYVLCYYLCKEDCMGLADDEKDNLRQILEHYLPHMNKSNVIDFEKAVQRLRGR